MKALSLILTSVLLASCGPLAEQPTPIVELPTPAPTPTPTPTPTPKPTLQPTATTYQDPLYRTDVNVTAGTYQDGLYTPAEGNFSCNFGEALNGTVYPTLQDTRGGPDYGAVWSTDGYGQQFAVDYFRFAALPDETKALLEDPQTTQDGLQKLLEDVLLPYQQQTFPGLQVVHQDFVKDEILFVVIDKPHGSNLSQNNVALDSQEAFYVFVKGEWFYFVSHDHTPMDSNQRFDSDQMQARVAEFYEACEFKP